MEKSNVSISFVVTGSESNDELFAASFNYTGVGYAALVEMEKILVGALGGFVKMGEAAAEEKKS